MYRIDVTVWDQQRCNQFAAVNELPTEQLLFVLTVILASQVLVKGATHVGILISWIICAIFLNISLYLSGSRLFLWTNIVMGLIISVSYEIERNVITHFLHAELAKDAMRRISVLELALANKRVSDVQRDLASKLSMVRYISHEIRTPLNTVYAGVELLEHSLLELAEVPSQTLNIMTGIRSACGQALVVVNEFLTFDKIESGLERIERSTGRVNSLISDIMKEFMIPANAKNIVLQSSVSDAIQYGTMIHVDFLKIALVLRNLLSNAIKFTPPDGLVSIKITRLTENSVDYVIITVKDSGAGLSESNVANLFKEGVQFNANKLQAGGGSGFGLYISKGIMDLHEGKFQIYFNKIY